MASNAKKVLPFLDVAGVLESAVLYASDISDAPTAILSSGMVSCNNFSFNILTFQTPPLHVCVSKADELSIRKSLSGKCKGEFTPRWLKRENKMKLCCVPGCSVGYELGIHVALHPLR